MEATAIVEGNFRYQLTRRWEPAKFTNSPDTIVWCMLNPSVANAREDDPTLRRCISYSQHWGYNALCIVNLYALRTPDPGLLKNLGYPQGPDNWKHIDLATRHANTARAVLAWGSNVHCAVYARAVARTIAANIGVYTLGLNKDGQPGHPLYLKKSLRPKFCNPDHIGVPTK